MIEAIYPDITRLGHKVISYMLGGHPPPDVCTIKKGTWMVKEKFTTGISRYPIFVMTSDID